MECGGTSTSSGGYAQLNTLSRGYLTNFWQGLIVSNSSQSEFDRMSIYACASNCVYTTNADQPTFLNCNTGGDLTNGGAFYGTSLPSWKSNCTEYVLNLAARALLRSNDSGGVSKQFVRAGHGYEY